MAVVEQYLIDMSVLARMNKPEVAAVLLPLLNRGLVSMCAVTELELGYSARNREDRDVIQAYRQSMSWTMMTGREWLGALETQTRLMDAGHHRGVGIPDLLLAATAADAGLTMLHYDHDFDLIAEVTGQPTRWVVPRGTVS